VTAHAEDMVLVPRAELDTLRAENRRLRREAGDREALKRIRSDSGEGRTFDREELARRGELVSDRSFASRTEPGMSLKDCRNYFGTPPTGRSFTCSRSHSVRLPTRFPNARLCGCSSWTTGVAPGIAWAAAG
jgi:hypothetical protein